MSEKITLGNVQLKEIPTMLKLENIYGGYRANHSILNGVSLNIAPNDTLAIIGQNGAGKSTLVKAILGMLPHCSGTITFDGNSINNKNTIDIIHQGIAYFMQGGRLFPHLTIKENLIFAGREQNKKDFNHNLSRLKQYFDLIGHNNKFELEASYLSGGEKHQLAMAMTLINNPRFLILDEPSAGLSPQNTEKIYEVLEQIKKEHEVTILLIEQNVDKAIAFSNRVALLKNGVIEKVLDVSHSKVYEEIDEFYFE
jgi:ABC-type branched-subunit amino acid transport system ATPase component